MMKAKAILPFEDVKPFVKGAGGCTTYRHYAYKRILIS